MTEQGVVLSVKDEFAQVRVGRNSACASCGKCGMTEKQKYVDFYARKDVDVCEGDTVELDIPEGNSAKFALIAYFIPLVPALALLFLALGLKWADWLATILFFVGLAVGFAVLFIIDKARKHKWMESPIITKVVHRIPSVVDTAENANNNQENTENSK